MEGGVAVICSTGARGCIAQGFRVLEVATQRSNRGAQLHDDGSLVSQLFTLLLHHFIARTSDVTTHNGVSRTTPAVAVTAGLLKLRELHCECLHLRGQALCLGVEARPRGVACFQARRECLGGDLQRVHLVP